jgi:hypothetical protein
VLDPAIAGPVGFTFAQRTVQLKLIRIKEIPELKPKV